MDSKLASKSKRTSGYTVEHNRQSHSVELNLLLPRCQIWTTEFRLNVFESEENYVVFDKPIEQWFNLPMCKLRVQNSNARSFFPENGLAVKGNWLCGYFTTVPHSAEPFQ